MAHLEKAGLLDELMEARMEKKQEAKALKWVQPVVHEIVPTMIRFNTVVFP